MATVTPFPTLTTPDAWTQAVHTIAAKVLATFPTQAACIAKATALVLASAVEEGDSPTHYTVSAASDPSGLTVYDVHCGSPTTCTCEAYTRHTHEPDYRCKHILAVWIARRAAKQVLRTADERSPAGLRGAPSTTSVSNANAPAGRPQDPLAAALPEAAFSLCLKGRLSGQDAQLTIRGSTFAEFAANVAAVRGLLDAPAAAASPEPAQERGADWCGPHATTMKLNHGKDGRTWYSHRTKEGSWCKGVTKGS